MTFRSNDWMEENSLSAEFYKWCPKPLWNWTSIDAAAIVRKPLLCYTVKGFGVVNKAEVDVFLELSCFFYDPVYVGNLIPGSCAFSKSSLNIWKFLVHVLLKPHLENFEHYFDQNVRWVQLCGSLSILWHCLSLGLEWKMTFSSPVATADFSKFAGILSASFTASSFRIWNSSAGIPSFPLALFVVSDAS